MNDSLSWRLSLETVASLGGKDLVCQNNGNVVEWWKVKSIWVPFPERQAPRKGFELLDCIWEASPGSTGRRMGEADRKGEMASVGCLTWEVSYNVGSRSPILMGGFENCGPEFSPLRSESLVDGHSWEKWISHHLSTSSFLLGSAVQMLERGHEQVCEEKRRPKEMRGMLPNEP